MVVAGRKQTAGNVNCSVEGSLAGSVHRSRAVKLFGDNEQIEVVRGDKERELGRDTKRNKEGDTLRKGNRERFPGKTSSGVTPAGLWLKFTVLWNENTARPSALLECASANCAGRKTSFQSA